MQIEMRGIDKAFGTNQVRKDAGFVPVSYTHLDVYKRQCLPFGFTDTCLDCIFQKVAEQHCDCLLYTSVEI